MDKNYILKKLSEIDKKEFSILEIGLFGSYVNGNNTKESVIYV